MKRFAFKFSELFVNKIEYAEQLACTSTWERRWQRRSNDCKLGTRPKIQYDSIYILVREGHGFNLGMNYHVSIGFCIT